MSLISQEQKSARARDPSQSLLEPHPGWVSTAAAETAAGTGRRPNCKAGRRVKLLKLFTNLFGLATGPGKLSGFFTLLLGLDSGQVLENTQNRSNQGLESAILGDGILNTFG